MAPFGDDAAADHFGDGAGNHHRGPTRVQGGVGAGHGRLGAGAAQLDLAQAGDDDGPLVGRQGVGVMQDGRDRQVLAAHGAVDDHLQPLDGAEAVDGTPIATGPVEVTDQHATALPSWRGAGVRAARPAGISTRPALPGDTWDETWPDDI